ncbi:hypothetical protein CCHR01_17451 [Colletotrichum chrysophilum]|uniref:Uncharacterized protein n=1 Tax=Colletotrichum chrysophilum TaxID=1836956 RepID=A0AAD9A238_9PEZI|nr:hypothetical protein CCHR01_17451 [Colletotrichum chrysophilum]
MYHTMTSLKRRLVKEKYSSRGVEYQRGRYQPRGGDGFSPDEVFGAIRHQMLLREHIVDAHPDPTCADVAAAATCKSLFKIRITQYSQTIIAIQYPNPNIPIPHVISNHFPLA